MPPPLKAIKRNIRKSVFVTPAQSRELDARAADAGLSISDYILKMLRLGGVK